MNDYPYNRIILDIVELSQELRQQGKPSTIMLGAGSGLYFALFESDSDIRSCLLNQREPLIIELVQDGDCEAAMNVWKQMMMHIDCEDYL